MYVTPIFAISEEIKKQIQESALESSGVNLKNILNNRVNSSEHDFLNAIPQNISAKSLESLLDYIDNKVSLQKQESLLLIAKLNIDNYNTFKRYIVSDDKFKRIFNNVRSDMSAYIKEILENNDTTLSTIELVFINECILKLNSNDILNLIIEKDDLLFATKYINESINTNKINNINNILDLIYNKYLLFTDSKKTAKATITFIITVYNKLLKPKLKDVNNDIFIKYYNLNKKLKEHLLNIKKSQEGENNRIKELKNVEDQLLSEFVGWDDTIFRIMSAIRMIELHPTKVTRPIIIPLISFPGYGKTTLIQRLVNLMGWQGKFKQYNLKPGAVSLPIEELKKSGETVGSESNKIQQVVLYDEIQNLVEHNELYFTTDEKDETKKIYSDEDRKKRNDSIDFFWQMLGNGIVVDSLNKTPEYYINALNDHSKNIININYTIRENSYKISEYEKKIPDLNRQRDEQIDIINGITNNLENLFSTIISEALVKDSLDNIKSNYKNNKFDEIKKLFAPQVTVVQTPSPAPTAPAPVSVPSSLSSYDALVSISKDEKEARLKLDKIKKEIDELEKKISTSKDLIQDAQFKLQDFENNSDFLALLNNIKQDFPEIIGKKLSFSDDKRFINDFVKDPALKIESIRSQSSQLPQDKLINYKRIIIFFTGNPAKVIHKIKEDYRNVSENQIDPDTIAKYIEENVKNDVIRDWFRELFGANRPGLESRFRLSAWELIRPFDNKQWVELIINRLESYEKLFNEEAKKYHLNVKIKFDSSVQNIFYKEWVAPIQGPRGLFDSEGEFLGTFITNLISYLIDKNISEETLLHISYNSKNNKHFLVAQSDKIPPIEISIGLHNANNNTNLLSEEEINRRQRIHLAGYIVTGIEQFHSVPKYIENIDIETLGSLYRLWPAPSDELYLFKKRIALTYLGAYSAECEFMSDHYRSPKANLFYPLIKSILESIKKDFTIAKKSINYSNSKEVSLDDIIPSKLSRDPFFIEIDRENYDLVIDNSLVEVREIVQKNKLMISAIANELHHQKSISNEHIKKLYKLNLRTKNPKELWKRILEVIPFVHFKDQFIYTPHLSKILSHDPGSIGPTSYEVLSVPYIRPPSLEDEKNRPRRCESFYQCLDEFVDHLNQGYVDTEKGPFIYPDYQLFK